MKEKLNSTQEISLVSPSNRELFLGFLVLSLSAFGGALPVAYRMLVSRRKWLTSEEFVDLLALCHFLPGPNVVNMAVVVGSRFHKIRGAFSAVSGLMALPMLIVIGLAHLYTTFKHTSLLQGILRGINPAAAGLMLAMVLQLSIPVLKTTWPFSKKGAVSPTVFMIAAFVSVGIFHVSLPWVLLILAPLSVVCAWWTYKNETS